ncbi:MAG: VOC family protein [Acidimicrobiia bacterium]|nr:VOC family protein [Acidimicrobiia bacterium]
MTNPPADAQITFLPARDLAASREFYEGVLGLQLVLDQASCLIFRTTDQAYLGVCEHLEPLAGRSVVVTIVSDDVDGWCSRIEERGGTVETGPEHNDRFSIYHAFVRDPDGHHIEIQRFDDPNWSTSGGGQW